MRWKKALIAVVLLLVLMIAAAYGFLSLYDLNNLKPILARVVKNATGRELIIGGDIDIKIGFKPTLLIKDLSFQNAPWGSRPDLITIRQIEVRMAIFPLLWGNFDFTHLLILEPNVILEFNKSGRSNLEFETGAEEDTTLPVLIFRDVRIENGVFTYKDEQSDQTHTVGLERLQGVIPGLNKSLKLDGEGTLEGIRFTLKGTVGPIAAWIEAGHRWPVDLTVKAGGASFAVRGAMRDAINFKDLSFNIAAQGPSTSEVAKLAGMEDLPELGAFELAARISDPEGKLAVEEVDIRVGSEQQTEFTLKGTVKDLLGPRGIDLDFSVRGNDAASLTRFGLPPPPVRGVFSATGRISDPATDKYALRDLEVTLGEHKISGQIDLNLDAEPHYLSANLASQQFDLGRFTLRVKLVGSANKLTMEKLDLQIGTERLALIKLSGTVKDLMGLQGVNLNFGVRGRNLANFKEFTGHQLPVQGGFRASGKVLIPAHKDLRIPNLKVVIGKNNISGSLELNLTGKKPRLNAELSSQELNLRSILIQEHAKRSWARGLDDLGPVEFAIETSGFLDKLSVEKVAIRVGTDNLAELRLKGAVKDLFAQSGIDLNFTVQGRNVANLKKFVGQSPPVVGEYVLSGRITDFDAKVYRVSDLRVGLGDNKLAGWVNLNLAGQWPEIAAELSTERFNLKPLSISSTAALEKLKKLPDLGPLKLNVKVKAAAAKLSIQQIDLNAGTKNLLKVKLKGTIKDLIAQRGLKLNFEVQGDEIANLEELTGQSVPLQGAFGVSGEITDPATKAYRVNNLELILGDNQISGWLALGLVNKRPRLTIELSAWRFNLKPFTLAELESLRPIPDLGPFELRVTLTSSDQKLIVENLDFNLGSDELVQVMLKGSINDMFARRGFKLEFAVRGKDLSNISKVGGPEMILHGPFSVSGRILDLAPKIYQIPSLEVVLGDNDSSGSVELNLAEQRPRVTAELWSQRLDLRPLLAKPDKEAATKSKPTTSRARKDKVFSSEPWSLDRLQLVDADIKIRNKETLLPNLALADIIIDIMLRNGNLEVRPLKFAVGGGTAAGEFTVGSQEPIPNVAMEMKINELDLGAMLDELGASRTLEGKLYIDFRLRGRGNSTADLMAGSNGDFYLWMHDGKADSMYLDLLQRLLGTDVLQILNPFQHRRGYAKVNCLVNQIDIKNGMADSKLMLDTDQTNILSSGVVNFKTEQLNFGIKPTPKRRGGKGGASIGFSFRRLSQPFRLGGTLANPSLVLDPTQTAVIAGKFAGALFFGPIGIAAFFADVSAGKKDLCPLAIENVQEAAAMAGQEPDEERKARKKSCFLW